MIIIRGGSRGGKTDGRTEARRSQDEGTGEWLLLMVLKVRGSDTGPTSGPLVENTHKLKREPVRDSTDDGTLKNSENIHSITKHNDIFWALLVGPELHLQFLVQ